MANANYASLFVKYQDSVVLQACATYAQWTIAALGADPRGTRVELERDFQSVGALLVNHLASRMANLMFPVGTPFFQLQLKQSQADAAANQRQITAEELASGLAVLALEGSSKMHEGGSFANIILLLKHLIVTGNVLIYVEEDAPYLTVYGLNSYVTRRDHRGRIIDLILKEVTSYDGLPPEVQRKLKATAKYADDAKLELYTRVQLKHRHGRRGYEVSQQIDGQTVGRPSWYPAHLCPYIAATWSLIPGEHYGRGMVEDYAGDFAKLSNVSEAETMYLCEMLRVIHTVGHGGDVDEFANAETGAYIRGQPDQVQAQEAGDAAKAQQANVSLTQLVQRLSRAFMYNSASVRDSERTTAYELRQQAQEAEEALGGSYSMLAQVVQVPLARLAIAMTDNVFKTAVLTEELVPNVIVGVGAMGRTRDVQNLLAAGQEIIALGPLAQMDPRLSMPKMVDIILQGHSVDPAKVFLSPQEQKKLAEAQQQQATGAQQLLKAADAADQIETMGQLQQ